MRNKSVGDVINESLRLQQEPLQQQLRQAQLEQAQANTAAIRAGVGTDQQRLDIAKSQLRNDTDRLVAQNKLTNAQADRIIAMGDVDLQRAQAELKNLGLTGENLSASTAGTEARTRALIETIPVRLSDGRVIDVPRADVGTLLSHDTQLLNEADRRRQQQVAMAGKIEETDAKKLEASNTAESNILNPPKGSTTSGLSPYTDQYNANSKKPYLYVPVQVPGTLYGSSLEIKRLDLPRSDNPKIPQTALEVYREATIKGLTVKDYVEKILFPALHKEVKYVNIK